jgi:hypothetical protein
VKISTFSENPKTQRRLRKLWFLTVSTFFILLGLSIVNGLIDLSVPENRVDNSLEDIISMFTLGYVLAFWLVKWVLKVLWNLPTFVLSEWRYVFLLVGMFITYYGGLVRSTSIRRKNRAEQIRLENIARESLASEEPINVEIASSKDLFVRISTYQELIDSYVDEIEENEDNFLNSHKRATKSLSVDELVARKSFLTDNILSFEKQIELIKSEIEERESDEAWFGEVLREED